jgi:hypothetical protein
MVHANRSHGLNGPRGPARLAAAVPLGGLAGAEAVAVPEGLAHDAAPGPSPVRRMRALRERERRGLRRFTIDVSEDDLRVIAEHGYEGAASADRDQQAQAVGHGDTDGDWGGKGGGAPREAAQKSGSAHRHDRGKRPQLSVVDPGADFTAIVVCWR